MSVPPYNKDKYYRIMDVTQSNYANQLKRLSRDKKRADFILIYYSLALIIYSLSVQFYPEIFDETWSSYSSIILSVIVLVYSVVNSHAEYSGRISSIQHALNEVKRLKREVGSLPNLADDDPLSPSCGENQECEQCVSCESSKKDACEKLDSLKKEYDDLVSATEIRDDLDFYYTILHLCKKYDINPKTGRYCNGVAIDSKNASAEINDLIGYISENNPRQQSFHVMLLKLWHAVLYATPIVIFIASAGPILNVVRRFINTFLPM